MDDGKEKGRELRKIGFLML